MTGRKMEPAARCHEPLRSPTSVKSVRYFSTAASSLLSLAALCCVINAAEAKPARCFTTDDGSYACEFRATGRDGSFQISAPGKPTYLLNIDQPGLAYGFVAIEGRNVPLPGRYQRSRTERGCWVNDTTRSKICAK